MRLYIFSLYNRNAGLLALTSCFVYVFQYIEDGKKEDKLKFT